MKRLISDATFSDNEVLKSHYMWHHSMNKKRCDECKLEFKNCRLKKKS